MPLHVPKQVQEVYEASVSAPPPPQRTHTPAVSSNPSIETPALNPMVSFEYFAGKQYLPGAPRPDRIDDTKSPERLAVEIEKLRTKIHAMRTHPAPSIPQHVETPDMVHALQVRVMGLASKISALEACLSGQETHGLPKNLMESLETMQSQCQFLQPANLSQITKRISSLHEKITSHADRIAVSRAEKTFQTLEQWQQMSRTVYLIAQRLESLHHVHQEAILFQKRLDTLADQQERVHVLVSQQKEAMATLERAISNHALASSKTAE